MRKFIHLFFVTILILLAPLTVNASCNILIDGTYLISQDANGNVVEPFIENGTTYVPVRGIAKAFDIAISWDQETKTVFIGEKNGSPTLGDNINIFSGGKEFIAKDANGESVYPVLKEGTTYLPIRGIGQLFGKDIFWDNHNKTAILITKPQADASSYLSSAISNTNKQSDITALVSISGTLARDDTVITQTFIENTERYALNGFSLFSILPSDYMSGVSYLGGGNYFIYASSSVFVSDEQMQKLLDKRITTTSFSPMYINLSTQGGYITDISIKISGTLTYNYIDFNQSYTIKAKLQYPENFKFPLTPAPDKPHGDNEESISADMSENSDSKLISDLIEKYFTNAFSLKTDNIIKLLHNSDYVEMFYYKSNNQVNVYLNTMKKRLTALYENCDGTYTVDSMVYTQTDYSPAPEKAAKVIVNTFQLDDNGEKISSETEVLLIKRDGAWHLDPKIINKLIK